MKTDNVFMIEMSYEDMKSVEGGGFWKTLKEIAEYIFTGAEIHDAAQEFRDGWNAAEGADEFCWDF